VHQRKRQRLLPLSAGAIAMKAMKDTTKNIPDVRGVVVGQRKNKK
jgi:hypothetical protein